MNRDKDTATLRRMIKQAEAQAGMFKTLSANQVRALGGELLKRVGGMERKMARFPLQDRRNKVIAHLQAHVDGKLNPARTQPIPYDDLRGLYREAINITNDLAKAYKGEKAILISFHAAKLCKEELKALRQVLLGR